MKKMKALSKRGLALLVALLMCVTMLPMSAFAAEGDTPPTVSNPTEQVDPGNDGDGETTDPVEPDESQGESQDESQGGGQDESQGESVARIGDVPYATLQDAIDAAKSGDTIVLTKDLIATGNETPKSSGKLYEINAKTTPVLTIDLDGHTVDCIKQYGWLQMNHSNSSGMSLTVKNGWIQNAANCSQGSAIWTFGALTLDNLTISGCTSTAWGGAVYAGGNEGSGYADLTVSSCTFRNNEGNDGGAVWTGEGARVNISDTCFSGNSAAGSGGAFYVNGTYNAPTAEVTLSSCTFENNHAVSGGAVFSFDNTNLTVTGCTFNVNNANGGMGGAICAAGNQYANMPGTLTVNGNTAFKGNAATYGGALSATFLHPSTVEDVTFTSNVAGNGYGGAAYCSGVRMTFKNVMATGNQATYYGGGFYLQSAPSTITDSTIKDCLALYGGGGIANYFAKLTLADGAAVHNNTAKQLGDDIYSSDAKYHESNPASLELCVPVDAKLESDGEDITGWYIDGQEGEDGLTNRWSAEGFYKEFDGDNSVVALKAAYEPHYTVSFDSAGGSAVDPITGIKTNETATKPADPTRNGYTFVGWQLDGRTYDFDAPVTRNITLVAQWRQNSTPVTPPSGGGEDPTPPATRYTVNWEDGDGNIIKTTTTTSTTVPDSLYPADPEKEDATFLGWGEPDISGTVITIIAEWDEEIIDPDVPLVVAPGLDSTDHFAYILGYGDGTVRPGKNITRAEVATIFYRLMTDEYREAAWTQTNDFSDVNSGSWFNNAVSVSAEAGLVKGYADGTFKGNKSITRAEFAAIAARFIPNIDVTVESYPDTVGHWAEQEIRIVTEAGWFTGDNRGFRPNDLITRAEAMTVVNRMLNRVPHAEDLHEDMTTYPDNQPGTWYYAAVQEATNSHEYEMGDRDGETVETWSAMKANRNWAALEKEWSNAYSGSNGNDVM